MSIYDYYAWISKLRAEGVPIEPEPEEAEEIPEVVFDPVPADHESGMAAEILTGGWKRKQRKTAEFIRWRYRNGDYVDDV